MNRVPSALLSTGRKGICYLSFKGYEGCLKDELMKLKIPISGVLDRLFVTENRNEEIKPVWAQNIWLEPSVFSFSSISNAVSQLKSKQMHWAHFPTSEIHDAKRIQTYFPRSPSSKPLLFPLPTNDYFNLPPMGSFTLLSPEHVLSSPLCSSVFPNGEISFVENKTGPPSRAYLKLYEALTLLNEYPQPQDTVLDLGSSPGSWTWALSKTLSVKKIISCDRSDLSEKLNNIPNIEFQRGDAFKCMTPDRVLKSEQKIDWVFSDMACEPEKLYSWLTEEGGWLSEARKGTGTKFVCTLKLHLGEEEKRSTRSLQMRPDMDGVIDKFKKISKTGRVVHLVHNKHELTWMMK